MKQNLPDSLLSQLSEFIAARTALHFPRERWGELERKMIPAAKEFGFTYEEEFVQWLVSSSLTMDQIEILASHLTIGETYFWREPQVFEALEGRILPELIRSREKGERRIRIWSAGCATGEEPYSIAIALSRMIPSLDDWCITILATDINPRILRRATAGVFGKWSFRNAPRWLKGGYFCSNEDGKYEILPKIRQMVTFAYLNLAEDIYPSPLNNTNAMDIIFCRNVLMYFTKEHAVQIANGLYNSLVHGGWQMVGASELSHQLFPQFAPVNFPGAVVYRKIRKGSRPPVSVDLEQTIPRKGPIQLPPGTIVGVGGTMLPALVRENEVLQVSDSQSVQQIAREEALNFGVPRRSTDVEKKLERDESPQALGLSVRELANQGKLVEALALCERAIAKIKLDPVLYYLCATILQEQNKNFEAITALKRALYIDPDFVLAHFAMGNLELHEGNVRGARRCFENVLALLSTRQQVDVLPESEGLTAGRLREIVHATLQLGALV